MEQKLQNRYGRWGRALCFALALALAALLSLTALPLTGMVYADEDVVVTPEGAMPMTAGEDGGSLINDPCELKVDLQLQGGTEETKWDLEGKDVQVDLYLIAEAVEVPGYNIYAYGNSKNNTFAKVISDYVNADANKGDWTVTETSFRYTPKVSDNQKGWEDLSQLLAEALFKMDASARPAAAKQGVVGTRIEKIQPGLYLMVPHGDMSGFSVQDKLENGVPVASSAAASYMIETEREGANGNTETVYSSIAVTPTRVYTFTPQLVSLPGLLNTYNTGTVNGQTPEWTKRVNANAKAGFLDRYASLRLHKSLPNFDGDAAFVFEVRITPPNGSEIVRNIPMMFTGAGDQYVNLSDLIPMGSKVEVKELYSGAKYTLDTAKSTNTSIGSIPAGSITLTLPGGTEQIIYESNMIPVTASFTNNAKNSATTGTGIVNHFESIPDNARSGYTWNWTQIGPVNP